MINRIVNQVVEDEIYELKNCLKSGREVSLTIKTKKLFTLEIDI